MLYRVKIWRAWRMIAVNVAVAWGLATTGCHFDCALNFHPILSDCDPPCDAPGSYGCDDADPNSAIFGGVFSSPPEEIEPLPWPRFHPVPARPVFEPPHAPPAADAVEVPAPPSEASYDHPIAPPVVTR